MSSSCFKIISCGSRDSFDNDEDHIEPSPQGKDKRGWSFRKRSARHRVLSNTVISETPSSGNKGSPVSAAIDFQCQPSSDIREKVPAVVCTEEKTKLSTPVTFKLSETITPNADEPNAEAKPEERDAKPDDPLSKPDEFDAKPDGPDADVDKDELNADSNRDESAVILIQSAVRALLAQKLLLESKNIIKLQAAVRGHLERRHAAGTLRCVQAIIKMQILVRARRARILEEESNTVEGDGNARILTPMGNENASRKPHVTYTSIEKLLRNKFARQLMDSTPRTKSINIKCDPLKSDSAWKWLERWMAVSPTDEKNKEQAATQERSASFPDEEEIDLDKPENPVVQHDKKEDKHIAIREQTSVLHDEKEMENILPQKQKIVPSESNCNSALNLSSKGYESHSKLISHDADRLGVQARQPTSELSHNLKQLEIHNTINTEQNNSVSEETKELEFHGRGELNIINVSGETETRSEQKFESQERSALEKSETQGNKLIAGSRKASNPNFLAAQSKFKELSSESYVNAESSFTDQASRKESGPVEDLISSSSKMQLRNSDTSEVQLGFSYASNIQIDGSECGTELSITSTLDSPERSDVGLGGFELEGEVLKDLNGHSQGKDNSVEEAKVEPTIIKTGPGIFDSDSIQPERCESSLGGNGDHVASSVTGKAEQQPESDVSKLQAGIDPEKVNSITKSFTEASPRSHVTATEPQGTPSSEVSVRPKRTKGEKSGSNHKHRSSPAGKTSPSNPNHGSGERSSVEQSHKDHKIVKRRNSFGSPKPDHGQRSSVEQSHKDNKSAKPRNSFGSPKPDHVDQEPRDSSSSNPIPSYMQPTESARAKALLNSSPRSSPDVLDKDVSIKKRHSLPGGNGRQGSPQVKRTLSEVPQTVKGNDLQPQQDKMWRR